MHRLRSYYYYKYYICFIICIIIISFIIIIIGNKKRIELVFHFLYYIIKDLPFYTVANKEKLKQKLANVALNTKKIV